MPTTTEPSTTETTADHLWERLSDPKVTEGLNRLLNQLDTVAFAVESVDGLIRRGEVITDSLSEGVAELRKGDREEATAALLEKTPQMLKTGSQLADAATDLNVDELTKSKVLERLTDAETLRTLNLLLDKLPLLALMLQSLEDFIARGETLADNLNSAVGELKLGDQIFDLKNSVSMLKTLPKMAEASEKLLASELMGDGLPKVIEAGVGMVDSGMMDRELVRTLGDLGRKSMETYKEVASKPVAPVGGLFATLKATKDPDVQKTVGFFFAFLKTFAKHLR